MKLVGSNGLCDSLIEASFHEDAVKLLREIEMTAFELTDSFELLDVTFSIAFQYLKLNKKKEILEIIKKVDGIDLKKDASDLLVPTIVYDFGEILVQLKEFGKAKEFFLKAFRIGKLIEDEETLVRLFSDKFLIAPRTKLTFETIGKIKEVVEILEKSILFPHSHDEQDRLRRVRRMNRSIIHFFVQAGLDYKALQLARIIDNKLAKPEYLDYYNFSIGARTLLTSGFTSQIRESLDKINNKSLKIDLLLQMEDFCREKEGKEKSITAMNEVEEIFHGVVDIHAKAEKAGEIALSWLDAGYPDRTMKMLAFETDLQEKALTIFMIAQYYVLNSEFSSARRLISAVNEPFRSLITSKIAAKMMCNNKKREAVRLFKSTIVSLVEKNLPEFLPGVFLDYLTSKKYKVVRTEDREVYVD
jgi:tetratricopeptide (TPR) repeat protein